MPGVQTAQPYGSDLPRSVTAGEGGEGLPLFLLLAPAFHQLTGLWKDPLWRKGDALAEAGPYQKSRGEGRGEQRVVLAAPRAELLNPGHRLYSWLI